MYAFVLQSQSMWKRSEISDDDLKYLILLQIGQVSSEERERRQFST